MGHEQPVSDHIVSGVLVGAVSVWIAQLAVWPILVSVCYLTLSTQQSDRLGCCTSALTRHAVSTCCEHPSLHCCLMESCCLASGLTDNLLVIYALLIFFFFQIHNRATDWDAAAVRIVKGIKAAVPGYKKLIFVEGVGTGSAAGSKVSSSDPAYNHVSPCRCTSAHASQQTYV